jgi:Holliday junction resolvase
MVKVKEKGDRGEREFLGILTELLGLDEKLSRTGYSQSDKGGCDCIALSGYAIEIKNCKQLTLPQWWRQTLKQAQDLNRKPLLAYKIPRKGWKVVIPFADLPLYDDVLWKDDPEGFVEDLYPDLDNTVTINPEQFSLIYKYRNG